MPGFVLAGAAQLEAGFGRDAADAMNPDSQRAKALAYMCEHQVPLSFPQLVPNTGAGIVLSNDQAGPMTGFYWSIRRLEANGFSAGTIQVYKNAVQTGYGAAAAAVGELLFTFPSAGTYTFGRREMLLHPDDNVTITGTGLTLVTGVTGVTLGGAADQFPTWYLSRYGA